MPQQAVSLHGHGQEQAWAAKVTTEAQQVWAYLEAFEDKTMSGLLSFIESAATAGADMLQEDRKNRAEMIKQKALAEIQHRFRMAEMDSQQTHQSSMQDDQQSHQVGMQDDQQTHQVDMQDDQQGHQAGMQEDQQEHDATQGLLNRGHQSSENSKNRAQDAQEGLLNRGHKSAENQLDRDHKTELQAEENRYIKISKDGMVFDKVAGEFKSPNGSSVDSSYWAQHPKEWLSAADKLIQEDIDAGVGAFASVDNPDILRQRKQEMAAALEVVRNNNPGIDPLDAYNQVVRTMRTMTEDKGNGLPFANAKKMATAEAEEQAGWLSTDATDFAGDDGNRAKFITRRTQELMKGDAAPQQEQLPAPQSRAEMDALKPGTRFKAPDGTIRVKQ